MLTFILFGDYSYLSSCYVIIIYQNICMDLLNLILISQLYIYIYIYILDYRPHSCIRRTRFLDQSPQRVKLIVYGSDCIGHIAAVFVSQPIWTYTFCRIRLSYFTGFLCFLDPSASNRLIGIRIIWHLYVMCWPFPDGLDTSDSLTLTTLPINYYLTTDRHHTTHWWLSRLSLASKDNSENTPN